jgi:hypothetical protein
LAAESLLKSASAAERCQIRALNVITKLFRAQSATANQGSRTLSAGAVLLSTRQTGDKKLNEREKETDWGLRNGIARTTKNMRRVRLFVVPALQPW